MCVLVPSPVSFRGGRKTGEGRCLFRDMFGWESLRSSFQVFSKYERGEYRSSGTTTVSADYGDGPLARR